MACSQILALASYHWPPSWPSGVALRTKLTASTQAFDFGLKLCQVWPCTASLITTTSGLYSTGLVFPSVTLGQSRFPKTTCEPGFLSVERPFFT